MATSILTGHKSVLSLLKSRLRSRRHRRSPSSLLLAYFSVGSACPAVCASPIHILLLLLADVRRLLVLVGIDIENNVYSPLGPGSIRIATTAEDDIARSLAQLAILSLDPATASTVPANLRIAGQNVSYEEIRDAVSRVEGVPKGEIKSLSLEEFNRNLRKNPTTNVLDYIRCVRCMRLTQLCFW